MVAVAALGEKNKLGLRFCFNSDGGAYLPEDAFGQAIGVKRDQNPYRFVGESYVHSDDDVQLQYMWNRWYDPKIGRFISRDPIGFGFARGLNLYGYAHNNPLIFIDPLGLAYNATISGGAGLGGYASVTVDNGQITDVTVGIGLGVGLGGTFGYQVSAGSDQGEIIGSTISASGGTGWVGGGVSVSQSDLTGTSASATAGTGFAAGAAITLDFSLTGIYKVFFGSKTPDKKKTAPCGK